MRFTTSALSTFRVATRGAALAAVLWTAACKSSGDSITVSNGNKVTALRFVAQPSSIVARQTFSVSVELISATGDRVTTATDQVTLTVAGGATLSGTTTVAAAAGLASFNGISVSAPASSLQLTATGAGFTVASTTFAASDPCVASALTFPGTTTGTLTTTGCLLGTSPGALYNFTASGTGATTFSVSSSFGTPELVMFTNPPGPTGVFWYPTTASGSLSVDWLLPAGSYQVQVVSRTGTPGTFTLTGTSTPISNASCSTRTLVVGLTLTNNQALASTDCQYPDPSDFDGTYFDGYAINSQKACVITMQSTTFTPYIDVTDGANNLLNVGTASGTGSPSTATLNLATCSTGGAPIIVRANSLAGVGPYTITVSITGGGS